MLHTHVLVVMLNRTIGGKRHTVEMTLSLTPLDGTQRGKAAAVGGANTSEVCLDIDRESTKSCGYTKEELLSAIESGVETASIQGTCTCTYVHMHSITCWFRYKICSTCTVIWFVCPSH